jgi:hypothetical protein
MSKKLVMGVVALSAVVALAMIPGAAEAVPHYKVNNAALGGGKKVKSIAWGKLKNKSAAGEIACENMALGNIENPEPLATTPGAVQTLNFVTVECTIVPACPAGTHPAAKPIGGSLPWEGELDEEEGVIRQSAGLKKPVKVEIGCYLNSSDELAGGVEFFTEGTVHQQNPKTLAGAGGCNKPSELEFDTPGSGTLTSVAGPGETTGSLKTCGYAKQDGIETSNP